MGSASGSAVALLQDAPRTAFRRIRPRSDSHSAGSSRSRVLSGLHRDATLQRRGHAESDRSTVRSDTGDRCISALAVVGLQRVRSCRSGEPLMQRIHAYVVDRRRHSEVMSRSAELMTYIYAPMPTTRLFISHSHRDKLLADALQTLLTDVLKTRSRSTIHPMITPI